MGILSRSNSSGSSRRRQSQLVQTSLPIQYGPYIPDKVLDELQSTRPSGSSRTSSRRLRLSRRGSSADNTCKSPVARVQGRGSQESKNAPTLSRTAPDDVSGGKTFAQSLLSRGRKLKSSASRLGHSGDSSMSSLTRNKCSGRSTPVNSARSEDQVNISAANISGPCRFQHLAHASPQQFKEISTATNSDLVADFSAMRAAQSTRRDFRGIRTVEIHSRASSVGTSTRSISPIEDTFSQSSPTFSLDSDSSRTSLQLSEKLSQSKSQESLGRRSVENYSRPFSSGAGPSRQNPPCAPPPRKSSRAAKTRYEQSGPGLASDRQPSTRRIPSVFEEPENILGITHEVPDVAIEDISEELTQVQTASAPRPSSPRPVEWPVSLYGCTLSWVDEEEFTSRSPTPSTIVLGLSELQLASLARTPDPQFRTTSVYIESPSRPHSRVVKPSPMSISIKTASDLETMRRSSLNDGLFTSWSFEDDLECDEIDNTFTVEDARPDSGLLPSPL